MTQFSRLSSPIFAYLRLAMTGRTRGPRSRKLRNQANPAANPRGGAVSRGGAVPRQGAVPRRGAVLRRGFRPTRSRGGRGARVRVQPPDL